MNTVKIGKTNYEITSNKQYQASGFDYTEWAIKKGNTEKALVYNAQLNQYTLWSGRGVGMPKLVEPIFHNNDEMVNAFFSKVEGAYKN
ncbi:MAG: hypothetical protein BWY65_02290 [Firmicutes bacterium ADurb.Bin373]|jgi:hypothetical protein|nr:MAG: hypothetical protein BWY65_02290 [Firmicutes bacterium ADurb.Bin373]